MTKNILYLREMGMTDNTISTDIKNHRVRTTENIDIIYRGKKYNMFFEFTQCTRWRTRTKNKRTGEELKHPVREVVLTDALHVDTEYERTETNSNGRQFKMAYCLLSFESETWEECHKYTRRDILEVVNRYKVGEKFTEIVFIK